MSSNILIPVAIVASCLIIVLALSLRGRERKGPKIFQLRVPQKKRKNETLRDEARPSEDTDTLLRQSLPSWHKDHENDLLHLFEILDELISGKIDIFANENSTNLRSKIEEASLKHPSPEIGAELTAILGNANSIHAALTKDPLSPIAEQRKIYQDYRVIWVSRIRQYADENERLIRLQNH